MATGQGRVTVTLQKHPIAELSNHLKRFVSPRETACRVLTGQPAASSFLYTQLYWLKGGTPPGATSTRRSIEVIVSAEAFIADTVAEIGLRAFFDILFQPAPVALVVAHILAVGADGYQSLEGNNLALHIF